MFNVGGAASMKGIRLLPAKLAQSDDDGVRANLLLGMVVALALVGGVGGWIARTSLAGAVIAGGTVVVESNVKKVQHQTGGIVKEILVGNGDHVKAGDVLVRLDQTQARASLQIVSQRLDSTLARKARLEAEAYGSPIMLIPDELQKRAADPAVAAIIEGERNLFESRAKSLGSQKAQLDSRNEQYREQIVGLKAQQDAAKEALALVEKDLATVRDLYKRKLVSLDRISALEMQAVQQKGESGRLAAAIAEVQGKASENALLALQLDADLRKSASTDLRDAETQEDELVERKQVAEDELTRTTIRAPQTGFVQELAVHTVGGVAAPGEALMLIVPESDELVVDAQVAPMRIDDVEPGQPVRIRFSAFDRNTTPECHGSVQHVSHDLIKDQATRSAYYEARVVIDDEKSCLKDTRRLQPGMPAEVYIETGDRTVWSYIMKPLIDQVTRAFKE